MESTRKIASNFLWTPQGVVHNPLVTLSADGRVLAVEACPEPDRTPFAEFYAGVLVPGFEVDWRGAFARMQADGRPLDEQLRGLSPTPDGVLVVISGLDYETMRLTSRSQIRKL